ncbi:MAG: carbohydrate kinase family protein [Infirmifilum sp.]
MRQSIVFAVSGNASIDEYYLVDQIPKADEAQEAKDFFQRVGGAATNVAVAMARLGVSVCFIGVVGRDQQGEFIINSLEREGASTKWVLRSDKPTGRVLVLLDSQGNRAMVAVRGANLDLAPGIVQLETVLAEVSHLHLSSTKPEYSAWAFRHAKTRGLTTSYDPGMAIAAKGINYIKEVLEVTDVLLVNQREYQALGGETLQNYYHGLLVVKEGEKGSRIPPLGLAVPAFHVNVSDTTGAGDAFNAAFLVCWKLGQPLEKCLLAANAAGAIKSTRVGAHASPTLKELNDFLISQGHEPLNLTGFRDTESKVQ